ncbi:ABC transporter ATP-binding protein [Mycoplasmopsis gallinacea]|uniref:ABC-type multidrug/protein/lipid transport system ATPase component n=1 Tax=Mycoplasmopsis gallinacea TaxID=29556 RepID=A0A449A3H5_9BACT|nr:ABC transporter ATP-binding protein [Mycoplasmopsis gallinacea]VEU58830.1 ABC-type multidrug/protein/lipid transport system ATPase component [Mycoplasmopsis gallinacea]
MQKNSKKVYLYPFTTGYRLVSFLSGFFVILEVVAQVLIPFFISELMDKGLKVGTAITDMHAIVKYGLIILGLSFISLIFGILSGVCASKAAAGLGKNIRKAIYENIVSLSFKNLDKYSSGSLITRMTNDIINVQNAYLVIVRTLVRAPIMIVFAIIMAFVNAAMLASVLIGVVFVLAIIVFTIMFLVFKRYGLMLSSYDKLNNKISENLIAMRTIKAFAKEEKEFKEFEKQTKDVKRISIYTEKLMSLSQPIFSGAIYLCVFAFILIATNHMVLTPFNEWTITPGVLVSFFGYMFQVLISFVLVAMSVATITIAKASVGRIKEILGEKSYIQNPENPITEVKKGSIEFVDVYLKYNTHAQLENLSNINLKINAGETIGIIGETGSSKSSLVSLLPRLYDVTSGKVLIDGHNVKDYDVATLRDAVSMVLQKNTLFSGTIRENMLWGNENATDSEIIEALKQASAYEFVFEKENGLDSKVEEGGNNFSGGQKQRLCIARALLKKSKIIVLDDSTSAVDNNTDRKIREEFSNNLKDVTKLIIAQRITSIENADRIIVLDDGKVSGYDTHENLLKNNEFYANLWKDQLAGGVNE